MSLKPSAESRLPLWIVGSFYGLFSLLPGWPGVPGWVGTNSLILSYPWVSIWQIAIATPMLWLLWLVWQRRQWPGLGNRLDWPLGFMVVGGLLSALQAMAPQQACWQLWPALGFVAALYALSMTVQSSQDRDRLLQFQGYLSLGFILVSLGVWGQQTYLPELARLSAWQQAGIPLPFSFAALELRNWAPTGHPNYVAGYLVLVLPLLGILSATQRGWQRWLWLMGVGLGYLDLYTTSSRIALGGLAVAGAIALGLLTRQRLLPRRWVGFSALGGAGLLVLLLLTNNRLRSLVTAYLTGQSGGDPYRLITSLAGWEIVQDYPWLGAGPGAVPLLYQRYRPAWAGGEAEQVYQLHNTPLQLWAELGLWGVLGLAAGLGLLLLLLWRWLRWSDAAAVAPADRLSVVGLASGLGAYGVISLTDYQLDNPCISGYWVVAIAWLASLFRDAWPPAPIPGAGRLTRAGVYAGLGICLAVTLWLAPIHRAWYLASQAFMALARQDFPQFEQQLTQAQRLAPWDPYYSQQLAWNLGDRSLKTGDARQRQASIDWFKQSSRIAPDQEFSYTNLGWLLLSTDPVAAGQVLAQAAVLVPAKRGVFYGLGLSLLAQGQTELAREALILETLIDPMFMSSPLWRLEPLQGLYSSVLAGVTAGYTDLLKQTTDPVLLQRLHRLRGGVFWWQGDRTTARQDWQQAGATFELLVLDLDEGKDIRAQVQALTAINGPMAFGQGHTFGLQAWLDPSQRSLNLQRAWASNRRQTIEPGLLSSLQSSMEQSTRFDQWLQQNAPTRQFRRERSGFGVLSRHVDGPAPVDFPTVLENIPLNDLLATLLPSSTYAPELDRALQGRREQLLNQVLQR